ncbi:MAG: AraC family transcriptional regulator [Cytophagales bacterium]
MKYFLKFNYSVLTQKVFEDLLSKHHLDGTHISMSEVELEADVWDEDNRDFVEELEKYGIAFVENQKTVLVEKIKEKIGEYITDEKSQQIKFSNYIADTLGYTYGYLSNVFSEVTYTSIENFMMIQKVENAKMLLISGNMTLTELAYKLNYSSVAHLSTQFKNVTGITPTAFLRILQKRKEIRD